MKILTTLFGSFRGFSLHSPAVAWRSVMPANRLGMIVCGAFLGLVSAVVLAKMHEPAAEPDKEVAAAAAAPQPKVEPAPEAPAPPESETAPAPPAPMPHTEAVLLPEPDAPAPPHPADLHPRSSDSGLPAPHEPPPSAVALNDLPVPTGGFRQVNATEPVPSNAATPPAKAEEHGPPPPPAPPGPMLEPPPPPPPAPSAPETNTAPPLPDGNEKKEKDQNNPKEHSKDDKDVKKPEKEKPEKEVAAPAPPAPPQNNGMSEPPLLAGPPSLPTPPPESKEAAPKAPEKITPPEPPPVKAEPPVTAPEAPAAKQDKVTVVIPPSPAPARVEPPPFVPARAPQPIASTSPSGAPLVDSWDERTYVAKPGDTFAAISQSEYKTEDYAKALQMYNQNHPRAGDAMRRDGTMAPGDRIYLPPSPVLEKRHADVIVRSKPKPVTAGSFDDGSAPVQADFRPPADKPANPTYKVQGSGETLFNIAAHQLGNGDRWKEIATLNPQAPTDSNVLGGTLLQMPAASAAAAPPVPHP